LKDFGEIEGIFLPDIIPAAFRNLLPLPGADGEGASGLVFYTARENGFLEG
jgi:hypothetical protein